MVNHIVYLEDDRHLYNILKVALHSARPNLKLMQFADGEHLLRYVAEPPSPIDLILLDIRVPGRFTGLQIAYELRKEQSPTNIIITSAYGAPDSRLLSELDLVFVPKPWNLPNLIRQLLNLEKTAPIRPAEVRRLTGILSLERQEPLPIVEPLHFGEKSVPHLRQMVELTQHVLKADHAAFFVIEPDKGTIQTCISIPEDWETVEARNHLNTVVKEVIKKENAAFVSDIRPYISSNGVPIATKMVSLAALRIVLPNEHQGVVYVVGEQVRKWYKTDYDLLRNVAGLLSDAVENDQLISSLKERNDELNSYSATIAHDLKTPLAAIIAYADVIKLLMIDHLPAQIEQYLNGIIDSSTAMSDMITRLLWLARLDHPLKYAGEVKIMPVVEAALQRLQYHIRKHDVTINVPSDFPSVIGHDVWIEEVFANLISNAIKYMGEENPQPTIEIHGYRHQDMVKFEVKDNGIGISSEDQAKLFTSFLRLNKVNTEGLGLGLIIILRIVSQLKGQVGIESKVGVGSTFWFTLPAGHNDLPLMGNG